MSLWSQILRMKSLFFTLTLLCTVCINQRLSASITYSSTAECNDFRHKENRDRPKLKTYHRPVKVFAPIKIGREGIWTVFTLVLILSGYVGLFFLSRNGETRFIAGLLAFLLLIEIVIILLHPIIWLIRWIRLLCWQMAWRRRYRACPGQWLVPCWIYLFKSFRLLVSLCTQYFVCGAIFSNFGHSKLIDCHEQSAQRKEKYRRET